MGDGTFVKKYYRGEGDVIDTELATGTKNADTRSGGPPGCARREGEAGAGARRSGVLQGRAETRLEHRLQRAELRTEDRLRTPRPAAHLARAEQLRPAGHL
jgi:hypothetical protein